MNASSPHRLPERTELLGKLLARVRPEFRVEVYLADPDDQVMGRRQCEVPGCDRSRSESGLCRGHAGRWRARSRPAMAVFLADPGPTLNGRRDLMPCSVSGCRYGSSGSGLCMRHRSAWTRDVLASGRHATARGATLRRTIINVPARLVRPQRRPILHLPSHWPWTDHWLTLCRNTIGYSPPLSATT